MLQTIQIAPSDTPLVHGGRLTTKVGAAAGGVDFPLSEDLLVRREKRDYRHWLRAWAQKILHFDDLHTSLTGCGQGPRKRQLAGGLSERVEIHAYPGADSPIGVVGLAHCASPLCPVCGPDVAHARVEEAAAAAKKLLESGYVYLFLTFTAWHPADLPLSDFMKKQKAAWQFFYKSKEYRKFIRRYPQHFSIVGTETTADDPSEDLALCTGWNLHRHEVLFLGTGGVWLSADKTEEIRQLFLAAWRGALEKVGLTCSDERGVWIQTIQEHARQTGLEVDFDKLSQAARERYVLQVSGYVSKALGFELSGGVKKSVRRGAKGGARVSLWRLLERAVSGDRRARAMWLEAYRAYHDQKISTFRMSPGLRMWCGLDEKTDEEIMQGSRGMAAVVFGRLSEQEKEYYEEKAFVGVPMPVELPEKSWLPVARQGRLSAMISHAEDALHFSLADGWNPPALVSAIAGAVKVDCEEAVDQRDILRPLIPLGDQGLPVNFVSHWGPIPISMSACVRPSAAWIAREEAEARRIREEIEARRKRERDRLAQEFIAFLSDRPAWFARLPKAALAYVLEMEQRINGYGGDVDLIGFTRWWLTDHGWVAPADPRAVMQEQYALL